jgi:hypothetical protein
MNATRIQISSLNAFYLLLAVVITALTAAMLLVTPKLAVARPDAASSPIAAEAGRLSENPELMFSRRYAAAGEIAALLAANPELMASRRFAASSELAAEAGRLSENPELMLSRQYTPPEGWTRQHLDDY